MLHNFILSIMLIYVMFPSLDIHSQPTVSYGVMVHCI